MKQLERDGVTFISGFRRGGNGQQQSKNHLNHLDSFTLQDGIDRLSRNVDNELPLYAAKHRRRENISVFSLVKNVFGGNSIIMSNGIFTEIELMQENYS